MKQQNKTTKRKLLVYLTIALIVLTYFILYDYNKEKNDDSITVPKVSGVYFPMDNSTSIVIVLDKRNPAHLQLATEVTEVLANLNARSLK
jgi:hypothetical protein